MLALCTSRLFLLVCVLLLSVFSVVWDKYHLFIGGGGNRVEGRGGGGREGEEGTRDISDTYFDSLDQKIDSNININNNDNDNPFAENSIVIIFVLYITIMYTVYILHVTPLTKQINTLALHDNHRYNNNNNPTLLQHARQLACSHIFPFLQLYNVYLCVYLVLVALLECCM